MWLAVAVAAAAVVTGLLALHPWLSGPATRPANATSLASYVSQSLGGGWEMLGNMSLTITPDPANGTFKLVYINGTSEVEKISPEMSSSLQLLGSGGQPNGGYPLWIEVYTFILKEGNTTYVTQVEVFRAANSTQAGWTLNAVEQRYQERANVTDGLSYVVIQQEVPFYNVAETVLVGVYKGDYLIVILSDYPSAPHQIVGLAEGLGRMLS